VTGLRFAWYGRLSTDDRQDVTLARPSQLDACETKVATLGGTITAEFFDTESGSHADRAELLALIAEARDPETRRFDEVIVMQTSRLSRNRVDAALFERDLRRLNAAVTYVSGGGSQLEIAIKQAIDEHERERLKVETRRGQRQTIKNGYRAGGRAPYGFRLAREPHPVAVRARAGETKSKLAVDEEQAPVVRTIFMCWVREGLGTLAIADRLNAQGVPSPSHTDVRRNVKNVWAASSVRHVLQNPAYIGQVVWDRTDHSLKRERGGGGARMRDESEWLVMEDAHPAIIDAELFEAAQARFAARSRRSPTGISRKGQRVYLLSGMVSCASGHQPLKTFGRARFEHEYQCCSYGRTYGKAAAAAIDHPQWLNVPEGKLAALVFDFLDARLFGEARVDLLRKQLNKHARDRGKDQRSERTRLTKRLKEIEQAMRAQIRGLESGVDPDLVQARIIELRAERDEAEAALRDQAPEVRDDSDATIEALEAVPDLSERLREAPIEVKRRFLLAIGLEVVFDRVEGRVRIRADIDPAMIDALNDGQIDLRTGQHGGGRIRTCEGRANAFTARPL
jgi:site-specific DNA recombinase